MNGSKRPGDPEGHSRRARKSMRELLFFVKFVNFGRAWDFFGSGCDARWVFHGRRKVWTRRPRNSYGGVSEAP
jgi:hypothetical protein